MSLTRDAVREAVVKALQDMLKDPNATFEEKTSPIDDLDLDSDEGLDFADIVSVALDVEIPTNVNPFKNDTEQRATTIGGIVDLLIRLSEKEAA